MTAKKTKYFVLIILASFLLGGCLGTRHLKENEQLLFRQKIDAPKNIDKEELRDLYVQKTNRKLFGILRVHYLVGIYYAAKRKYKQEKFIKKKAEVEKKFNDKIAAVPEDNIKKINNLQFRKLKRIAVIDKKIENGNTVMQWGEPLTLFDTALVAIQKGRFSDYLFSNGYFQNKVSVTVCHLKYRERAKIVKYHLEPGRPYFIDSIYYDIRDTAVYHLLLAHEKASLLKKGERYDQDNFTNERERIDLLLKDFGYYEFSRQYVEFNVDTAYREDKKVAVGIIIKDPAKRDYHKKFTITEVNFITDAGTPSPGGERKGRDYRDIHYRFYKDNYNLRILSQRVFILPGTLYSRSNTFNTQRQLANLDAFKFVNVNYDTSGGKFVANVYTSPLDRYQWSNEAGVNVTQGFPGPFYNMTFKKRNVFRGLETLDLSGRFGFEGVASATSDQNIYKSTEAGVNLTMTFPQIIFPLRERTQIRLGKYNPKTKLLTGYSFTERPEYRRTFVTLSGTYTMENKRTTQYSFTFANINIIDTVNTSLAFREFLAGQDSAGNFGLVNSFYPSFVNSMIFGITWNHNDYASYQRNAVFIRALAESGGTIWNFFDPQIITDNGLQYFKYLRFNIDVRRNKVLDKNTILAYRLNTGVTYPYGANRGVPYEKFFFAGGSNSIRAWRPRRLGPGSFKPNLSTDPRKNGLFDYSIEKPAEILLEGSIELRKKLFGFVNGAIFLDAGNVWSFRQWAKNESDNKGNAQFKWDQFYKEIAVGTGFGIRLDFTFLILRFDVGMKVIDPARDPGDRFVLNKVKFWKPYGVDKEPVIYNVGIGYPF